MNDRTKCPTSAEPRKYGPAPGCPPDDGEMPEGAMLEPPEDERKNKSMGAGMFTLAWLVLGGLLVFAFSDILDRQRNPNQSVQTLHSAGGREVVLQRNRYGHYVTDGFINEQPVVFLLDTGATGVAVPARTARRLGLRRGRAYQARTANGIAVSYSTLLESVSVGEIRLTNVIAGISPGLATDEILLGMSFLKHIEFTQRGDTLILRQGMPPKE